MIRILLVEDDEDDYIITRDFLNDLDDQDYQLDWAQTPVEAREFFQQDKHDVCLLDYSLGASTGVQLMVEAQALGFNAPIIILTGHDDSELDADSLSAGAVDYLVKSHLSSARLNRVIRYAVARKDMEEERLKRIQAQAENKSKSEFMAHLSHELRTPLTAILGYTDLLSHHAENSTSLEYVHIIKRNGSYLLSLLNDVLDLSKIEAGKLDTHLEPVNLNEILSNLVSLMDIKAREKNIEFSIHADKSIPQSIISDATRLQQILINIAGNAIRYTDAGAVRVHVNAEQNNDQCTVSFRIQDTGIGIDDRELTRLFQPFEQVRNNTRKNENGAGLGLAISQKLAERLNGHIGATSIEGKGSCFTIVITSYLPENVNWVPLRIDVQRSSPRSPLKKIEARILIADDLAEIRNLIGHIVQRCGAQVEYAQNGLEAIKLVKAAHEAGNDYDMVLMDMQMPVMDGLEATQQLRAEQCELPIIALTAQTMLGEKERCLAAGCNDYLGKPVQEQQLINTIQRHLPPSQTAVRRLLLVEDNADARNATQLLLEELGWSVASCDCISDAMHLLNNGVFDLILTDLNLPDGDGVELAKYITEKWGEEKPVVAVTGQKVSADNERFFSRILIKPLNLDQLVALDSV